MDCFHLEPLLPYHFFFCFALSTLLNRLPCWVAFGSRRERDTEPGSLPPWKSTKSHGCALIVRCSASDLLGDFSCAIKANDELPKPLPFCKCLATGDSIAYFSQGPNPEAREAERALAVLEEAKAALQGLWTNSEGDSVEVSGDNVIFGGPQAQSSQSRRKLVCTPAEGAFKGALVLSGWRFVEVQHDGATVLWEARSQKEGVPPQRARWTRGLNPEARREVLARLKQQGYASSYFLSREADAAKDDLKVVTACVAKSASSFQYASIRLRANLDLARAAVAADPSMFEYAAEELRDDASLAELALRQKGLMFKIAGARLRGGPAVWRLAIDKWSFFSSNPWSSRPKCCKSTVRSWSLP